MEINVYKIRPFSCILASKLYLSRQTGANVLSSCTRMLTRYRVLSGSLGFPISSTNNEVYLGSRNMYYKVIELTHDYRRLELLQTPRHGIININNKTEDTD